MYQDRDLQREVDDLRWELQRQRDDEERRQREARQDREARQAAHEEEMEARRRTASTWPEALQKQTYLFSREARQLDTPGGPEEDTCFIDGAAACRRALALWPEAAAKYQEKRAELERQLATLDDDMRIEVAEQLEAESSRQGWRWVSAALREDVDLDHWLNW